jgi:acetylglutamate kinase
MEQDKLKINLSKLVIGIEDIISYINCFSGKWFVIKIGGSVLNDLKLLPTLIGNIIFLKKVGINVVLVHGGSKRLTKAMKDRGLPVQSIDGLRVTTASVLELASEVFAEISLAIKKEIEKHHYKCLILGRETGFVKSERNTSNSELGFVGIPKIVEISLLDSLADNVIPVVPAVTAGTKPGDIGFNVNADDIASIIASKIGAEKLILMTDVEGVLDENGKLISSITESQANDLIKSKVVHGGMIPKVQTCLKALHSGVKKCHIIKGNPHSFIYEILTNKGVGTEFING